MGPSKKRVHPHASTTDDAMPATKGLHLSTLRLTGRTF